MRLLMSASATTIRSLVETLDVLGAPRLRAYPQIEARCQRALKIADELDALLALLTS